MSGDLDIPAGARVDSAPIEGGTVVLNASFPPGHPEHEQWRTLTNAELTERAAGAKLWAVQSQQARRAMLRLERNRRLTATDWTELPSAARRLTVDQLAAWAAYRQALRDLPTATVDPDNPPWPAAPGSTDEAADAANGGAPVAPLG